MATTLFYNEQMKIKFIGLDQRNGKECSLTPSPTISKVPFKDVRPFGADILTVSQNGDEITITANGNGTGTVTVAAYLDKEDDPAFQIMADVRISDGLWERKSIGSKSVINSLGVAVSEDVSVVEPEFIKGITTEILDPEQDCSE